MTEAKDDDSIVQYTWDSLGRALTEKQGPNPFGTAAMTVTLAYDAEGNTTQIDYPSGFEAHRTFDAIHRLSAIDDGSSNDVADFALYGGRGRRKQLAFGNGTTSAYTYDGFRRPTAIDHDDSGSSNFASFDYGWDKNDNPLYEARSHQSWGNGDAYSYDQANRLILVEQDCTDPSASTPVYTDKIDYNLDDVLNFTSVVTTPYGGGGSSVSFTSNGMNEYTAVGGTSRTFDDNGNLTDDGTNEYTYDWHNHLIEVVDSASQATIAEYAYDAVGRGRRIGKVVGSDTTRFVYHDQQCIEEYDGSDDLLRLFVFGEGLDEVVMMEAPDVADVDGDQNTTELKRFYFHTQLIGSVTQVTDPDENVVESYDFGPYGETAIFDQGGSSVSASQIGNPFAFTGRRLDEETGLYYYRARHYDPAVGRFMQRDPLEYVDGPNARAYVSAAPTCRVDVNGTRMHRPGCPGCKGCDHASLEFTYQLYSMLAAGGLAPPTLIATVPLFAFSNAVDIGNGSHPCTCTCEEIRKKALAESKGIDGGGTDTESPNPDPADPADPDPKDAAGPGSEGTGGGGADGGAAGEDPPPDAGDGEPGGDAGAGGGAAPAGPAGRVNKFETPRLRI